MKKETFHRYSVLGSDVDTLTKQVSKVGAIDFVPAMLSGQLFVSLTGSMVSMLRRSGLTVTQVQKVLPAVVTVPRPIVGTAEFTPGDLLDLLGLNSFKFSIDPPLSGDGYSVAVIDTGIRSTHQLLGGKVIYQENFISAPNGDGFNHGTGVAAIIHAIVPDALMLDMKVLDDDGNGTEEDVVLALEACVILLDTNPDIAPNVINMSLGSPDDGNPDNPIRVACRVVMGRGIVIVAAAGNNGKVRGAVTIPACEEYVAGVGSISSLPFQVSEFSSRGPTLEGLVKPDTVFLGEDIILASSVSDTATIAKTGTSFSTPLVSGVIVMQMEGVVRTQTIPPNLFVGKNVITPLIIIDNMLPTVCTKPEGAPVDKDNDYGYGVPVGSLTQNRIAAIGFIDWSATFQLSMTVMMMQMMAGMI